MNGKQGVGEEMEDSSEVTSTTSSEATSAVARDAYSTSAGDHLQQTSSGLWVYRKRVPADLIDVIGKREIKLALKTRNRVVAVVAASLINDEVEKSFGSIRETLVRRSGLTEGGSNDPLENILSEARAITEDALSRLRLVADDEPPSEPPSGVGVDGVP